LIRCLYSIKQMQRNRKKSEKLLKEIWVFFCGSSTSNPIETRKK